MSYDNEQLWNSCNIEDECLNEHVLRRSSSDASDSTADDNSRLRTENAILKAESKVLNDNMAKDAARTSYLQAELAAKGKEVEKLRFKVATITTHTRQECAGELEEIVRDLHVAVEKLVTENKSLKTRRREVERRMQSLQLENQALQRECLFLRSKVPDSMTDDRIYHRKSQPRVGMMGQVSPECTDRSSSNSRNTTSSASTMMQQLQGAKDKSNAPWTTFFAKVLSSQGSKSSIDQRVMQSSRETHAGAEAKPVVRVHNAFDQENPELD